jgi:hypothetical protein
VTGSVNINDGFYVSGNKQFNYAMMYHTASQPVGSTTTAYPAQFSTIDSNSGAFSIVASGSSARSNIKTNTTGWYNISYTAQLVKSNNGAAAANIWFRKDSVDVPYSNNIMQSDAVGGAARVITKNQLLYLNSGSHFEIMYQAEDTNISLASNAAGTTPTTPITPSISVVITQHA